MGPVGAMPPGCYSLPTFPAMMHKAVPCASTSDARNDRSGLE